MAASRQPAALRGLTASDDQALLELWLAAWTAAMPAIDFAARTQWFLARLEELRRGGFVLRGLVEETGRILGFIAVSPQQRCLDQLALHPDHWGGGLGASLMGEAKRLSPSGLVLEVNEDNRRAVAFYEKNGFRRLGSGRNPNSGLATFRYGWGETEAPSTAKGP